jgi:outer membrane receptor for ferric coprogen and ferric-rhodotorulic acid
MTTDGTLTHFSRSKNTVTDWTRYKRDSLSAFVSVEQKVDEWTLRADIDWTRKNYNMIFGYALRGALASDGSGVGIWPGRWDGKQKLMTFTGTASGPLRIFSEDDLLMVGTSHYTTREDGGSYQLWSFAGYNPFIPNYYNWQGDGLPEPDWPYLGRYGNDEAQTAAFGALRLKPLSILSVMLGGRVSNWRRDSWDQSLTGTRNTTRTENNGVVTPYTAVMVDVLRDVTLYASYTSIFQAQNNRDLNGKFLDPLTGKNYEVGAKASLKGGRLNLSGAWFRIEQSNFAVLVPGALGPTGDSVYIATDGTSSQGFEFEVTGEILPGWQVSGGFSHTKVKDRNGKPLNTAVPQDSVRLLSSYDLTRAGVSGLTIGGNLSWNSRTYADVSNVAAGLTIAEQHPYATVDGFARYELAPNLSLAVNATNLFDKYYYSKIAYYGNFGQARRIVGTLRAKF